MNVLVVGGGGREHSIVNKLAASKQVTTIYAAPGNGGMAADATCLPIKDNQIDELVAFAKENQVDYTIVGPEIPLLAGIVNEFKKENLPIFGPTKEAALIEGSKDFAKAFMEEHAIPTSAYQTFTDPELAKAYINKQGAPIVVKADGLAAGKGVVVAETVEEALIAVDDMLVGNKFGGAGCKVVIEEFLQGKEFSLMAFVHGENVYPMKPARDHKRAFDRDQGPNTGGMGAFAPVPDLKQADVNYAIEAILKPAAKGLQADGRSFTGILYAGLIETNQGPKVIEFNARLGDPETQVVLPLLQNDFIQVIIDVMAGKDPELQWDDAYCIGTVLASKGYPGTYEKGVALPKLPAVADSFVVHAGTKAEQGQYVSTGGRVLLVGAKAKDFSTAQTAVYHYLQKLNNDQFFYRRDIGLRQNSGRA